MPGDGGADHAEPETFIDAVHLMADSSSGAAKVVHATINRRVVGSSPCKRATVGQRRPQASKTEPFVGPTNRSARSSAHGQSGAQARRGALNRVWS
jgi:hypothetical protein